MITLKSELFLIALSFFMLGLGATVFASVAAGDPRGRLIVGLLGGIVMLLSSLVGIWAVGSEENKK